MEALKHECGLAALRLLKPLSHYREKYGTPLWGLHSMFLLLEKQHNRGQDGAGLACVRLNQPPGQEYFDLLKLATPAPPWQTLIQRISEQVATTLAGPNGQALLDDPDRLKRATPWAGELYLGHLRYATHGSDNAKACHPVLRANNWPTRTLMMAGNFNLTNNDFMLQKLLDLGQHPVETTDTVTVLERVGHFLDRGVQECFDRFKAEGLDNPTITERTRHELDLLRVLSRSAKYWDGGFLLGGLTGGGHLFALRDPNAIRPGYYFHNEEVAVVASERHAIATTFGVPFEQIQELPRAHAVIVTPSGQVSVQPYAEQRERTACSFERIYFSRGTDASIYEERKELGRRVVPQVLQAIHNDLDHTVFTYIPNTAKVAFWGMLKALEDHLNKWKATEIQQLAAGGNLTPQATWEVLERRVRVENVLVKDTKLRTFITNDGARDSMAAHVYDITYGTIRPGVDRLVAIDDSIVRGTTLRQSILRIISRLQPKQVVIVSSAPQIRFPDCYGIDMSQIERFLAFQAAIALLKDRGLDDVIEDTYQRIRERKAQGRMEEENLVKAIYAPFSDDEVAQKCADLLQSAIDCPLAMVFQRVPDLHAACPNHRGDWYFTGNYPTPGGNRVVNQAFLNYKEGRSGRAY